MNTYTRTHTHTYTNTHTNAHTHAHTRTHTHIHTHTHTGHKHGGNEGPDDLRVPAAHGLFSAAPLRFHPCGSGSSTKQTPALKGHCMGLDCRFCADRRRCLSGRPGLSCAQAAALYPRVGPVNLLIFILVGRGCRLLHVHLK